MMLYKDDFIKINKFSRPGTKLLGVKGIVLHYTANPGASASNHKRYFENLNGRYASAHIFIDSKESLCIIPLNEIAYHANERACKITKLKASAPYYVGGNANLTTVGIEICIEKDGSVHPNTLKQTIEITKYLMNKYNLTVNDVYRHYDVTGKNCPAFWVNDKTAYNAFRESLKTVPKSTTTKEEKPLKTNPVTSHKVLSGESLWSISKKYKTTVDSIKKLNNLKTDVLQIGQVLKIK